MKSAHVVGFHRNCSTKMTEFFFFVFFFEKLCCVMLNWYRTGEKNGPLNWMRFKCLMWRTFRMTSFLSAIKKSIVLLRPIVHYSGWKQGFKSSRMRNGWFWLTSVQTCINIILINRQFCSTSFVKRWLDILIEKITLN